jgi:hypothetical protein
MDKLRSDEADYSVFAKNRERLGTRGDGRLTPLGQSPIFFRTMVAANKAGKAVFEQLLAKLNT